MKLKLFLATLMALWSVDSGAQVLSSELSFRPVLSSMSGYSSISGYEISHQSELGLNKSVTLYELSGSITIPQLSLSGYYMFPKTVSGNGRLLKAVAGDIKDDYLPVTTSCSISLGRVEIAIPFMLNRVCKVEPVAAYQSLSLSTEITGGKYNYSDKQKSNSFGAGIEITEQFSRVDWLSAKYLATQNTSLFQVKYRRDSNLGFVGVGYDWWNIDFPNSKIRMNGPAVEIGLRF